MELWVLIVYEHLMILIAVAIAFYLNFRWKIPVVVLRYTGDKNRPTVLVTKARKVGVGVMQGIRKLVVKGYKLPVRDFNSKNYYPGKTANGALILWEFKSGWLTPAIPKKVLMGLSDEEREKFAEAIAFFEKKQHVSFEFKEEMFNQLVLNAIDDVDAEYFLRQQQRQDAQYTGGLKDFLMKHGGSLALVLIATILLVGYIVYLDKVPSVSGQCIDAGVQAARNTWLSEIAKNFTGVPLG